jgi:hypothetical protein
MSAEFFKTNRFTNAKVPPVKTKTGRNEDKCNRVKAVDQFTYCRVLLAHFLKGAGHIITKASVLLVAAAA